MKKIFLISFLSLTVSTLKAQSNTENSSSYRTALGVKVFDGGGITFKHFLTDRNALELIAYFWGSGTRITGLYEIHGPIKGATGLQWYIGPGAHIAVYNKNNGDATVIGIDGVLGLDYKFRGAPINMSIDWQPSFELTNNRGFVGSWLGLAIRYTF